MTRYHVHVYREMRLSFADVEASSHEEAARIARDKRTEEADAIDDCDGTTFAALVDVSGDESHELSRTIDFEEERLRKAATALVEALDYLLAQTVDMDLKYGVALSEGEEDARALALAAIAAARG